MACAICGDLCNRIIGGYSLCDAHATGVIAQVVNGASPNSAYRDAVLAYLEERGEM